MKYKSYNYKLFKESPFYEKLPLEEQETLSILTQIFHFKVNSYVLEFLIDWDNIPNDSMYRLAFPKKEMLDTEDFQLLKNLVATKADPNLFRAFADSLKTKMYPKVVYDEKCLPKLNDGTVLQGAYKSFANLIALFPSAMVRTCHAYCSYCYRWITFGDTELQNTSSYTDPSYPVDYLKAHPEITDVYFTGADPMTLGIKMFKKYLEPVLEVESVKVIHVTTKSLAWWPFKYTTDPDAEELFAFLKQIIEKGIRFNFYGHFSHFKELEHPAVALAVQKILATGATIRSQAPLVKGVNDSAEIWAKMWTKQIALGIIPFYMFMESDHNQESCFRIQPKEALEIFRNAKKRIPTIATTVTGPVYMNNIHRIVLDDVIKVDEKEFYVHRYLQSPYSEKEGKVELIPC